MIRPHPRKSDGFKLTWKQRKNLLANFEITEKSWGPDAKHKSYLMNSLTRPNTEEEYESIDDIKRS